MKYTILVAMITLAVTLPEIQNRKTYNQDTELLAAIIHAECSNCSEIEMYLVGSVVINRWFRDGGLIDDIIYAPNQFHGTKGNQFIPSKKTRKVANSLFCGMYVTPDIYYFCTHAVRRKPMSEVTILGEYHIYGK